MKKKNRREAGIAVDAFGGGVVDPTANVIALTEAANKRQDDLRAASDRRTDDLRELNNIRLQANADHLKEMAELRANHALEMSKMESNRLDAIRQVDREEVAKTAVSANTAITILTPT